MTNPVLVAAVRIKIEGRYIEPGESCDALSPADLAQFTALGYVLPAAEARKRGILAGPTAKADPADYVLASRVKVGGEYHVPGTRCSALEMSPALVEELFAQGHVAVSPLPKPKPEPVVEGGKPRKP
jgi:hypothetical protein